MGSILIRQIELKGIRKDILIVGSRIEKIADNIEYNADTVISGKGKAIIPGFFNMHTHSAMTLMRGYQEDLPLHAWLNQIWQIESRIDPEIIYWGAKLACLEMIKSGTTTFNDQYWLMENAARAVEEMGIRAVHSHIFLDQGDKNKIELQREECIKAYEISKTWGKRNMFSVSVHSPYTVSEENILWAANFASDNNLPLHIHLAESQKETIDSYKLYGVSPTKRLKRLGILGSNVIAAHCVWLDEEDIDILGNRQVTAVHNVNSNLKLASGYKFPLKELMNAGANVTLGTDGCASSNNLDILEAMKTTAILQKAWRRDPSAIPIAELLQMTTVNSAKALKIDAGRVEEGALADLSIIDLNSVAFTPNINFEANLIYSANSSCVETVICDGKIVMSDRVVKGEEEILKNATKAAKRLLLCRDFSELK